MRGRRQLERTLTRTILYNALLIEENSSLHKHVTFLVPIPPHVCQSLRDVFCYETCYKCALHQVINDDVKIYILFSAMFEKKKKKKKNSQNRF